MFTFDRSISEMFSSNDLFIFMKRSSNGRVCANLIEIGDEVYCHRLENKALSDECDRKRQIIQVARRNNSNSISS